MLNWYRRWKEIRAAKIVDCSHMKKMPERSRLHLVFTILYAIAMVAVLWQHCHPVITILILALILPLCRMRGSGSRRGLSFSCFW